MTDPNFPTSVKPITQPKEGDPGFPSRGESRGPNVPPVVWEGKTPFKKPVLPGTPSIIVDPLDRVRQDITRFQNETPNQPALDNYGIGEAKKAA